MKTLLVYLPNNVIRSIFRVPRSFRRYVKLVFFLFDNKAKHLETKVTVSYTHLTLPTKLEV